MLDTFLFESPLGVLGKLANYIFLKKYMTKLLIERNKVIKSVAEGDKYLAFLSDDSVAYSFL